MKRCPECGREYDNTMMFCLDDGAELLYGPASMDEPTTAILHETLGEAATREQINTTNETAILPSSTGDLVVKPGGFDKRLLAIPLLIALIALGSFLGYRYFKPAASEQINSIAVLPFENRSGSADADYLSDGIADSLIFRLSQLPNLKVSPTSSVMRYKGKDTDVAQIAKELEVDAVMSGRLVQLGENLTISIQLIDARTKKLIWAEQYDRKMADLMATQREIAISITQKLQLRLVGDEKAITKKYTTSNDAYQLYLKGRFHWARRTKDDLLKAIDSYKQAIDIDPNFALAYVGMAEAYNSMGKDPDAAPAETIPKGKAAAMSALQIDPSLAEAHSALGDALALYDWDWAGSEREFKRAIELDPNIAYIHVAYAGT
ncbi:MAG TPA: tetratricopeptide repeat protein, partial [Pyrinomonadaceae bacterium]|nr:tetratricopeptide repeat protein [Pyrinomonadaceae bacterium]